MAELRVKSTGTLKLFESDNTSSVTIASPASLGADRTVTLPDADVDLTEVNTMPLANLDIDGGTEIGAAIVDADLFIVDDGAGGTNRKVLASRIKTYAGPSYDIGTFTRDISTADGTQAVTGVGFQPTHLIFHANISNIPGGFSVGFDDGTTRRGSGADGDAVENTFSDGYSTVDLSIFCRDVAGVDGACYEGKASSLDTDGFTITWNQINSPTGSLVVYYMAFA
jgi:hypothetical protein